MIPLHRITHEIDCYVHRGFSCTCDRPSLYLALRALPWLLAIAVCAVLALLAAVLK